MQRILVGILAGLIAISINATGAKANVKIEKTQYSHYGECYKISNDTVELFVTTEIGPRVICYRFIGGTNMFAELGPDDKAKVDLNAWQPWGGHRLWHAPEVSPRTYVPDNGPVTAEMIGKSTLSVAPPLETSTGIQKSIYIELDKEGTGVTLTHTLKNKGVWPIELAPWGLTIMNGGGVTIIPQEPFVSHDDKLLPSRPMVLWNFTDMADPRWTFGTKYVRLRTDAKLESPQKIGMMNTLGWSGYLREGTLFVKRYPYVQGANYTDYGCNCETYTAGTFMEVESLGPLTKLEPGESVTHVEHWFLFKDVKIGDTEDSLDKAISPLIAKTVVK